jgi:para-nitrobenzyl esterase
MVKISTTVALLLAAAATACGIPAQDDSAALGRHQAALSAAPAAGCAVGTSTDPLVVATTRGLVRGKRVASTVAFLGIPFAMPPVGALRFAPPAEAACWSGTLATTAYGSACPQKNQDTGHVDGNEDCLTLNVWTPNADKAARLPVLVFLYGGGHLTGSSNEVILTNLYDGQALATREQAVVVTPNYRLGALGFFADPSLDAENPKGVSGNQGTLDQIAALQWVQNNIAAFGGDPTRVMLFGESAGAIDVCTLMASPLAAGLFNSALMESGACGARTQAAQKATSAALAQKLGCTTDVAHCMRGLTAEQVIAATESFNDVLKDLILFKPADRLAGSMPWTSSVDGYVLPDFPLTVIAAGSHNKVPLIVGSNANEAAIMAPPGPRLCSQYQSDMKTIFGTNADQVLKEYPCQFWQPRQAQMDVMTDFLFTCTARHAARAAAPSASVFRYFFTHGSASGLDALLGAYHSLELAYVFHTFGAKGYTPTAGEQTLANNIEDYWGSLAATLSPATKGLAWPSYTAASEQVLQLDLSLSASTDVRPAKCDFWDSLYPAGAGG